MAASISREGKLLVSFPRVLQQERLYKVVARRNKTDL